MFNGFLVDYIEAKGGKVNPAIVRKLAYAARNAGAITDKRQYKNLPLYRLWVSKAPIDVLNAALGLSKKPAKPTNNGPPVEDALVTLRRVVSTLNAVVEQLEAARAINNALRNEIARLTAKARSAMVVYGD